MAAAAIYALENHVDRLSEDHDNARIFAESIATIDGVRINVADVESNLAFFEINPDFGTAAQLSATLLQRGVKINPTGPQRLRACTHLDVNHRQVIRAADVIRECLAAGIRKTDGATLGAYAAR